MSRKRTTGGAGYTPPKGRVTAKRPVRGPAASVRSVDDFDGDDFDGDDFDDPDEPVYLTFEMAEGWKRSIYLPPVTVSWLGSSDGLMVAFRDEVLALSPTDRHDELWLDRLRAFMLAHDAPVEVLATLHE